MTKKFNEKLVELLKTDARFIDDEGNLIRAAVIDRAWKIDHDLVKLLLGKPEIKKTYFDEIEGHWVFNTNTFIEYVSDKTFLADSYTRFRNKIGLNIDGKFLRERGEVSLVWPYKDCVLEGGQTKEEEKRKEIFFNETLAQDEIDRLFDPKVLTNWKRYTVDGERKVTKIKRDENGTIRENLIIKGNNLLALHILKKQFRGKVKLIYIDPPYNTGNDSFGYNDNFNHSSWLTFMKNRLEVARELLRDDGVILVHCDFIEDSYLKVLLDEIFGQNNYVNNIAIRDSHPSGLKLSARTKTIIKTKSTMLVYRKSEDITINPIYQPRLDWDTHFNSFVEIGDDALPKIPLKKYIKSNKICGKDFELDSNALKNHRFREFSFENRDKIFQGTKELPTEARELSLRNKDKVVEYKKGEFAYNGRRLSPLSRSIYNIGFEKYYEEDFGKLLCDFWDDIDFNNSQNEGGTSFPSGKKPELLLARLISMFTKEGKDIMLDFHLGSGTTAAVAHKMERQYIGVEQIDYGENDSVVRLQNVIGKRTEGTLIEELEGYDQSGISKSVNWQGGGDFIYCELMKYNETYMDKIQVAKSSKSLVKLWKDIAENSFLNWYANSEMPKQAVNDFIEIGKTENGLDKQKKLLVGLLNKNQLYVNLSEIDDKDFAVKKEDKKLNQEFYGDL